MLRELGISVEVIDSAPQATILVEREQYTEKQFQKMLTVGQKLRIFWKNINVKRGIPNVSYDVFLEGVGSELLSSYADAFCRFVFSASSKDIPLQEALMATAYTQYYGGPGIIKGGCKSIIDALCDYIQAHKGKIHPGCPVDGISINDAGCVEGVYVKGDLIRSDTVISDIGPRETAALLQSSSSDVVSAYNESVGDVLPAFGIKISFSAGTSLIGHSGVMFTPECQRIGGVVEVTSADSTLAPRGKHLFMSHQHIDSSQKNATPNQIKKEIDAGVREIESIFPNFTRDDILMVQTYTSEPVNRALQGCDAEVTTSIEGLYLVGDGVKDGIEVEGIARGIDSLIQLFTG
jgi:phytoene dehydrogenase-like protein